LVGPDAEKKSFMHALFLRNLTTNPLILKVFAKTKVGETSATALIGGENFATLPPALDLREPRLNLYLPSLYPGAFKQHIPHHVSS
jgi:hypothetical protein